MGHASIPSICCYITCTHQHPKLVKKWNSLTISQSKHGAKARITKLYIILEKTRTLLFCVIQKDLTFEYSIIDLSVHKIDASNRQIIFCNSRSTSLLQNFGCLHIFGETHTKHYYAKSTMHLSHPTQMLIRRNTPSKHYSRNQQVLWMNNKDEEIIYCNIVSLLSSCRTWNTSSFKISHELNATSI